MMSRRGDPTIIFALLCILCAVGVAAAWKSFNDNEPRLVAYGADAGCGKDLRQPASSPSCTVERATVSAHWRRSRRGSDYYHATIATADGAAEQVQLKGRRLRAVWDAMPVGSSVMAERFSDPARGAPRHVTAVRAADRVVQTSWNPAYRKRDSVAGLIALSIGTIGCGIGWMFALRRRRRLLEMS
jgi:hypothetical protein